MYKNNNSFVLKKTVGNVRIYVHENISELHTTRYVEALNQQIYSKSGANAEILEQTMEEILKRCNDTKNQSTFRTDVAALANSVKYRLKYPVDQHCAIRMGAILSFYEEDIEDLDANGVKTTKTISEVPDQYDPFWQSKKERLAFSSPEFYSFFLTWGIINTPKYNELLDTLNDTNYFEKREQAIRSMVDLSPLTK